MTPANHANAPTWLVLMNISIQPQGGVSERGGGEEASRLKTFNQHGRLNPTRCKLKALTHHGTRVTRSTGAALVVDWGVPLSC